MAPVPGDKVCGSVVVHAEVLCHVRLRHYLDRSSRVYHIEGIPEATEELQQLCGPCFKATILIQRPPARSPNWLDKRALERITTLPSAFIQEMEPKGSVDIMNWRALQ
ncbi:hypothetical protein POX_d06088 [Penicillium oxalicum]|uniref:Uncharacterized protein n=1 Tax=Penicillium oxalicum (strain 114-2 / CGMCC 5302) TaxID=933388 RepID=S7ZMZ5_PENO1|nr:hypothetical protein POX_d06088 [Penicillium oxalicum]EPS31719.1 hypothetical protein PDE_06676 [Penicillium oxalicum 114-2]KAI2790567.1 hypothetical protein POX_d06088 [Penicillium oxalicum]